MRSAGKLHKGYDHDGQNLQHHTMTPWLLTHETAVIIYKIESWLFQVESIDDFEVLTDDEKMNIFTPAANEIRSVSGQAQGRYCLRVPYHPRHCYWRVVGSLRKWVASMIPLGSHSVCDADSGNVFEAAGISFRLLDCCFLNMASLLCVV